MQASYEINLNKGESSEMTKIDISQYDLNKALSNFGGYMTLVLSLYAIILGVFYK